MSKGLEALEYIKYNYLPYCNSEDYGDENCCSEWYEPHKELDIIEKELKALEIIKKNFKLVGNCLQATNDYAETGWVFVKELEDEEEHNAWKEVLK